MNEPPRTAYHLANVLFSDADQKRLILYMSSKYDEAQIPDERCSSRVIYGDPLSVPRALPDEVAAVKKKIGGAVTFGTMMGRINLEEQEAKVAVDYTLPSLHHQFIRESFLWAVTMNPNHLVRTLYTVSFLYLIPEFRRRVVEVTEEACPGLATAYFEIFDREFEKTLCGVFHRDSSQSLESELVRPALTPLQIAVECKRWYNLAEDIAPPPQ